MATRSIWTWISACKDASEKSKGLESQAFVSQWFTKPGDVVVRTTKEEKYGRMLAACTRAGEPSLCSELLERGLAKCYGSGTQFSS